MFYYIRPIARFLRREERRLMGDWTSCLGLKCLRFNRSSRLFFSVNTNGRQ